MRNQVAVAVGLIAGLLLGVVADLSGSALLLRMAEVVAPIGTAFIGLIRMVVVPLVATTIFTGVAAIANPRGLGKLGGITLFCFWSASLVAISLGMAVMKLALVIVPAGSLESLPAEEELRELPGAVDFLLGLIPSNPFQAAADGALLPLVLFMAFFGAAASTLPDPQKERLTSLAEAVTAALIKIMHWVLWTAPVGVFALAAPATARAGLSVLGSLAVFVVAVALGLFVFVAVVYLPAVRYLTRVRPGAFQRACIGPQAIAMSTTSSVATLPAMLAAAEQRLGLSRTVAGFVLPLGASLNRAGSALFQGAAIVFLAELYGTPLPAAAVGAAILSTFLVSLTVASVPSASVVTLAPALDAVGVPLAGMAVLLGIDRIPDMLRTATNVTGHLATAAIVERFVSGRARAG